ncbi:MAG: hypothetical protein JF588_19240 [Caulobacterales bacterium]|nr:hypothetical protein [Caulobacterales bacterium]
MPPLAAQPVVQPLSLRERRRLPAALAQSLTHFRSPTLPVDAPFALLPELGPFARPVILPSLAALARRIHRLRGDDGLELRHATVLFRDRGRTVTEVLAIEEASGRRRRIGFAWHAGRPWEALQAALDAERPMHAVEG